MSDNNTNKEGGKETPKRKPRVKSTKETKSKTVRKPRVKKTNTEADSKKKESTPRKKSTNTKASPKKTTSNRKTPTNKVTKPSGNKANVESKEIKHETKTEPKVEILNDVSTITPLKINGTSHKVTQVKYIQKKNLIQRFFNWLLRRK